MSKWCGDENCLQCVDKEPDPYVHLPREDYDALRAENARLRGLLAEIQYDCEHIGGIQHLDKAERRTWVSVANRIKAALQPKEPSQTNRERRKYNINPL